MVERCECLTWSTYAAAHSLLMSMRCQTGHQANLYGGNISTDQAIKWYTQHGATAHKINLGIPLYGRMFNGTDGLGKPFTNAVSPLSSLSIPLPKQGLLVSDMHAADALILDPCATQTGDSPGYFYKDLPHQGANVTEDKDNGASYSYDAAHHEFVSFDTPAIAAIKAKYVQDQGLAGSMFWDVSASTTCCSIGSWCTDTDASLMTL